MQAKPLLIGITGASGSGKTYFLRKLVEGFDDSQICIISQDNYYKPREEQVLDSQGVRNFDLPQSIKHQELANDLQQLLRGETVSLQEYTFNNEKAAAQTLIFKPAPIILVEGLFVFHYPEVAQLLDLKIFLHTKENISLIRRIKRDQIERNYPLDDVLYRYENHVMPTFERHIKPLMDESDIVINNHTDFSRALPVLHAYIRSVVGK